MLFLENQRRLGRRVKHGCVVAGPCFALYSDEAAWGRWGEWGSMPSGALQARPRSSSAADVRCVPGFGPLLLAPSHRGLVRIRPASAVGALGPQHLGGVFLVENLVAVAAFKCLLDHGGLLFRREMRFGRAAVRASCPLHGKARLLFLENEKGLLGEALEVWRTWSWRFGGHGVGYAASGLAGVASACRLRPGGRCGKCLVFEMLTVLARPRGRDA